jgi:signal transduction histidine kinase
MYLPTSGLRLPAQLRDITIDYTALSLVDPDKVRFRFKLEGQDPEWRDVLNIRRAEYSNLTPGNYRFQVIAANNSGIWNQQGASVDFSIAPAYWQTNWFRALCAATLGAVLWTLYRLRLRQAAHEFERGLDARVAERTRIARELHDTLLQSFQGLLLRFQTVWDLFPTRPVEAKEILGNAIDQASKAITEGREAVQGLRISTQEPNDLVAAIGTLGEELAADAAVSEQPSLRVGAVGTVRLLHPIIRDEIYRIAGEALRNSFKHSQASRIEVELRYDDQQFSMRVIDNGKGIDEKVLAEGGREGHYGLRGMRERAVLIDGKLVLWSAPDSGTEVELIIAASRAYTKPRAPDLGAAQ